MSIGGWLALGAVVLALLYAIVAYNRLVRLRALVRESWSGITVQLRRRADLVPNLVATVQGYAAHERALLDEVTAHRRDAVTARGVGPTAEADAQFSGMLSRLFAVVEAYPDLKADGNFRQLQEELSDVEEALSGARRYYNATIRDLNTRIQSFPDLFIARPAGFREEESYRDDVQALQTAPPVRFDRAG